MSVAETRSAASAAIPCADDLIARARALAPKLRERATKAERDRNIPRESVDEYILAGLIHTLQPKRWGGYEHDHETMFNIAIELGKSTCGSSAWCLNYLGDHACILAHFPEEAQHDVWSRDTAACIATSAAPTGKSAVAASGGYKLDGRWSWCSGLRHSQWIMIGGLVFRDGDHHPDMRLHLVPTSEVKQEDTWFCAGLSATGSNTVVLDNVFVPEYRSVSFSTLRDAHSPGSRINTNPIYRTPFIAVHSYALFGPALGLARGAYAEFVQWTKQRYLTYTLAIAQHVPVQIRLAEIGAQIDAAELLARRCLATARQNYTGMTLETRALLRRDWTYAMKLLRDAMDALIKISGSSGLMQSNPVQRCWRDVHTISSHVVMNWDVPAENFGRMEFGLGLNPAYPAF